MWYYGLMLGKKAVNFGIDPTKVADWQPFWIFYA